MPKPWLFEAGKSPFGPVGIRVTRAVSLTLLSGEVSIEVTHELEWINILERPPINAARA